MRCACASAVWIGLGALLTSAPGAAASFVSGDFDFTYALALGGGTRTGGDCYSSGLDRTLCAISGTASPGVFLPPGDTFSATNESENVSSALGSDSVNVSSSSSLRLSASGDGGFQAQHQLNLHLRDSSPASFHTTADGTGSFASSVIVDTTTNLLADEHLELVISLVINLADLDITVFADYQVIDLDTGLELASFSHTTPGSAIIDIDGINGHELAILFSGEFSSSQPAGFAGGAVDLADRSFNSSMYATSTIQVIGPPIPEPSTAALVCLGLLIFGARGARRPLRGSSKLT